MDDPEEMATTRRIRSGYMAFQRDFNDLPTVKLEQDARAAARKLVADSLDLDVLDPASKLLAMEQNLVRKSGDYNQELARAIAFFLLLIGICGAVAGVVAGFGIARSVSRSIVKLYCRSRPQAGGWRMIVGPIDMAPAAGIENLDAVLRRIADQVGAVVEPVAAKPGQDAAHEQMAALGQLAAGLAHELRNPLTSMKMLIAAADSEAPNRLTERRRWPCLPPRPLGWSGRSKRFWTSLGRPNCRSMPRHSRGRAVGSRSRNGAWKQQGVVLECGPARPPCHRRGRPRANPPGTVEPGAQCNGLRKRTAAQLLSAWRN